MTGAPCPECGVRVQLPRSARRLRCPCGQLLRITLDDDGLVRLVPAGPIPYLTVLAAVLLIGTGTAILLDAWKHAAGWWRLFGLAVIVLGVGCMRGNPLARILSIALACFGLVQFIKTGLFGEILLCATVAAALLAGKRGQR